jgi:hypothetical protein
MSDRRVVWVITHTVAIAIAWVGTRVVVGVGVGARCGSGIGLSTIVVTRTSRFDQLFLFDTTQYIDQKKAYGSVYPAILSPGMSLAMTSFLYLSTNSFSLFYV